MYELDFSFTNQNIRITVVFGYDILFIFIAKYPIIPQSAVKNEKVLNDIEYNLQENHALQIMLWLDLILEELLYWNIFHRRTHLKRLVTKP